MGWIYWAERIEDSRPKWTALHQRAEPGEVRHVNRPTRLLVFRVVRGAARAAPGTHRPAAYLEAQRLALLRRTPARDELAAPAVLASPNEIWAQPGRHRAAVEHRNLGPRIETLDRPPALAAAPPDTP